MKRTLVAASVAAALCFSTNVQAALFGDYGTTAWSRAYKYFELRFGEVAKDEVVLVLPTATNAAWDDRIEVLRFMEMYKWGDWMPSNAWQYSPNPGKRVSEGYGYFLTSALVAAVDANGTIAANTKNAVKRANEALVYARAFYNDKVREADAAYEKYADETPIWRRKSKEKYLADQGYETEIAAARKTFDDAQVTFKVIYGGIKEADVELLANARLRYDNPKQRMLLPPVRAVVNDRERWQTYLTSYIDKDIFAFLREDKPQPQSIQESSERSSYFEQRWSASVNVSFLGLVRVGGGSAEQTRREKHIQKNSTRIDITFENLDTFNIVRGEWFNKNMVTRFAGKLKDEAFTAVWGPGGQLELIPKTLLVGRGMSFAVYADSMSLDYLYEHFLAGADAGISIGWWRVGGSAGYSTTKEETKIERFNDRIVFTDLSGRAQVLAVLAKQYALGLPKPTAGPGLTPLQRTNARKEIDLLWTQPQLPASLNKSFRAKTLKEVAPTR